MRRRRADITSPLTFPSPSDTRNPYPPPFPQKTPDVISGVPLLQSMAHDVVFLSDICARLSPYSAAAAEFVYQRGEAGGDVFVLLRGELSVLDADQQTALFRIPEGTFFGEGTVLRALEGQARAKRTDNVWCGGGGASLLRIAQEDMQVSVPWL